MYQAKEGVGLDVVKSKIEALGGDVEVKSVYMVKEVHIYYKTSIDTYELSGTYG